MYITCSAKVNTENKKHGYAMRTKKKLGQFYSMEKYNLIKMKLSLIQYLEENVLSHIQKRA
jgi:hypothetical protein